jgi:hemin uptake protein HemP
MLTTKQLEHPYAAPQTKALPVQARVVDSRALLDHKQEIRIAHDGQEYRLRLTRNNKLILTK